MHLVGLYTYCKMIHGSYNIKLICKMYFCGPVGPRRRVGAVVIIVYVLTVSLFVFFFQFSITAQSRITFAETKT